MQLIIFISTKLFLVFVKLYRGVRVFEYSLCLLHLVCVHILSNNLYTYQATALFSNYYLSPICISCLCYSVHVISPQHLPKALIQERRFTCG